MIERRTKIRFPMIEVARYKSRQGRRNLVAGIGQTVNFSSSGALLRVQHPIEVGDPLDMALEWPVLLDGTVHMQLLAHGQVVRTEPGCIAIEFEWYQFRTRKEDSTVS
jgi:hypothetical protein